jgi:hypothetical protein
MKKTFLLAGLTLLASAANAVPISFDILGSSLSANGSGLAISHYSDNAGIFFLDDGQSQSFTFGSVSVLGKSKGELALNIDFAAPLNDTVTGTGDYSVLGSFFYNNGKLVWDQPITAAYNYLGNVGTFTIVFDNIKESSWFSFPTWDLTGTITNKGSTATSVPEPSSIALLAAGLLGIAALRRKTKAN